MTESSTISQSPAPRPDHTDLFRDLDDETLRLAHRLASLEIQRREVRASRRARKESTPTAAPEPSWEIRQVTRR